MSLKQLNVLIVDPSFLDIDLYGLLTYKWNLTKVSSVESALHELYRLTPDLVFISASFSISKNIKILDIIKTLSTRKLIPIIFVVDLSHKISHIPGTTWGEKIGIVHTLSSIKELDSTINRVLSVA